MRKVDKDFWINKKVFLTGHTGFKGSWMTMWLLEMGAIVKGYSLEPSTSPNLFYEVSLGDRIISDIADIRDYSRLATSLCEFQPDVVMHFAAQAIVRESYVNPLETYATNVMGTANLLQACRGLKSKVAVVIVTTDKCYENKEWEWGYRENEPMGGYDPYSSSKGCAELVTSAFRKSFFGDSNIFIASARAGNVIGGGDWAEDRLIPDILKSFNKGIKVIVRNPLATRPWQHVLEPISGYLVLAESLYTEGSKFAEAYNFGPKEEDCQSVQWILDKFCEEWTDAPGWELDKAANPHEARFLKLDVSKAKFQLSWSPKWNLSQTIERIVTWNKIWKNKEDIYTHCLTEIKQYQD